MFANTKIIMLFLSALSMLLKNQYYLEILNSAENHGIL